jgi:hypothetical protein
VLQRHCHRHSYWGVKAKSLSPALDDDPGLGKRVEDLSVEQFVAKPGVEALDEAVLPGTAPLDTSRLGLTAPIQSCRTFATIPVRCQIGCVRARHAE